MAELSTDVRETVRARYVKAAQASAAGRYDEAAGLESESGCCSSGVPCSPADESGVFGSSLYDEASREAVPDAAVEASLGCGVPTAVADLRDGEVVLDLGSGAGADVLISARRVAPAGRAIGLDMTDEMLELARANAANAGVQNVEFVKGYLEDIPLADESVDVVISNCVINLSADKPKTLREAARVLRPGGRFAISDVIADPGMDDATQADMAAWTGCIAGALTETELRTALAGAGLDEIEITPTHQVHQHASAAIIRARKPSSCCTPTTQASCCEASAKSECCDSGQHAAGTCGCQPAPSEKTSSPPEEPEGPSAMSERAVASDPPCPCSVPQEVNAKSTIPQCPLGDQEFAAQLDRYRRLSAYVQSIERQPGRLTVPFSGHVPIKLLQRTLEIERECCSFFGLDYDRASRQLTITVHSHEHEARLEPLFQALSPQAEGEPAC